MLARAHHLAEGGTDQARGGMLYPALTQAKIGCHVMEANAALGYLLPDALHRGG